MDAALLHVLHPEAYHRHHHHRKLRPDNRPLIPITINANEQQKSKIEITSKSLRKLQLQISKARDSSNSSEDASLAQRNDDGSVRALCRIGKTASLCTVRPELLLLPQNTTEPTADLEKSTIDNSEEMVMKSVEKSPFFILSGIQVAVQLSGPGSGSGNAVVGFGTSKDTGGNPTSHLGSSSTDAGLSPMTVAQQLNYFAEQSLPLQSETSQETPCWILRIQCTVMNNDGAVMDCLLMALIGALMHVEIPHLIQSTEKRDTNESHATPQWYRPPQPTYYPLPLLRIPLPLTSIQVWVPDLNLLAVLPDPTQEEHALYHQQEGWTVVDALTGQLMLQQSGAYTQQSQIKNPDGMMVAHQMIVDELLESRRQQLLVNLNLK